MLVAHRPQSVVMQVKDEWESIPLFVREKQLREKVVPISHGALWDWVGNRSFPHPVKLSSGVTAWKRSDLKAWAEGTWLPDAADCVVVPQ